MYALLILYGLFGGIAGLGIVRDVFAKGSGDVFVGLVGAPSFWKCLVVLAGWPLVLGYVLVKCLQLQVIPCFRTVQVDKRRYSYYELQRAWQLPWGRTCWFLVRDPIGEVRRFATHQEALQVAYDLLIQWRDWQFGATRSKGKVFYLSLFQG